MAPRRGGGSGSGGVACEYCSEPVTLSGYNWRSPYYTGNFAICCIALFALLACLFFTKYYSQWRNARGYVGKIGAYTYIWAVLANISYLVLTIVSIALQEAEATVTYSYLVLYVFLSAFSFASVLLVLTLLARFVEDGTGSGQRSYALWIKIAIVLLSLLATAVVALVITDTAYTLNSLSTLRTSYSGIAIAIELAFTTLYMCTVIGITVVAGVTARVYAGRNKYRIALGLAVFIVFFLSVLAVATSGIATASFYGSRYSRLSRSRASVEFAQAATVFGNLLPAVALVLYLIIAKAGTENVAVPPKEEPDYNIVR